MLIYTLVEGGLKIQRNAFFSTPNFASAVHGCRAARMRRCARSLALALALACAVAQLSLSPSSTRTASPWTTRTPTPSPTPSQTPVPQVVSGTIRLVIARLPYGSGCPRVQTACSLDLGPTLGLLFPAPVYSSTIAANPTLHQMNFYEAGSLYPNGPSGSTGVLLYVTFYQAPGAAPLSALVRTVLAPGSAGARAILASMARTSGYACTSCDILNASWSYLGASNCFPPTCFPPGTSSFEPPAAPTPTPSPTPNVASATVTMGSVTLSVVGLPSAACAAAESACLQAVINALTALLPPTAPAAKGGVAITKY